MASDSQAIKLRRNFNRRSDFSRTEAALIRHKVETTFGCLARQAFGVACRVRLDPPGVPLTMHLKPKFWFRLRWNHGAKYPILHNGLMAQLRSRVVTALL
jgi:hypothetical protein